ncbi:EAL domain-containing protein [Alteromonas lipolytica]|uniref:cyclic-guanylate-specific phosphodiesterase n=1 Tax=Alteromonas lipolytica TaxID=1856405 RepID=A0A1E8F8W2_9ALTE|nr:EAL domain-containing protein [Alteromonas lipolytica]OFI32359.1 diguanylate cyclase [Alteromonas lipolytica]GGF86414.1 bifunctional diguanylate cyclase/phosphodiesterase [Alteromonas lipolytica]
MPQKDSLSKVFVQTLEQAIDAVVVINASNDIILFNRAAELLWGYSRDEVIGQNVKILVPDDLKPHHDEYINANRTTGIDKIVGANRDIQFPRKDGSTCWGTMSISMFELDNNQFYTAIIKDITDLVKQRKRLELLSMVTDKTDEAIFITDENENIVYVNNGFERKLGYPAEQVLGLQASSLLLVHKDPGVIQAREESIRAGNAISFDEILHTRTNQQLWFSITANPVFDDNQKFQNLVVVMSEITQTKLHEVIHTKLLEKIAREEALEVVMDSVCREIRTISGELYPAIFNISAQNTLQLLAAPDVPAELITVFQEVEVAEGNGCTATAAFRAEQVTVSAQNEPEIWQFINQQVAPYKLQRCSAYPIKSSQGKVYGVLTIASETAKPDINLLNIIVDILCPLCLLAMEREDQKQNIRRLAYYDSLTGLPNRNLLLANADQALNTAVSQNQQLAVLFFDVDNFKQINDSFGHPAGDSVLVNVAARLKKACGNQHVCGRLSGDEFVAIVVGLNFDELNHFVEELKSHISAPIEAANAQLVIKTSIGISLYPGDGHDVETLLHRADMAMYQAKLDGKGHFAFYSHEINQLAQEKQALENALREAIENHELTLSYQPQVNLTTNTLYGVEALCRWTHPKHGSISPAKFIPLAEETGLIHDLSQWVLKEACEQLAHWRRQGLPIPAISINLSAMNFHDAQLKNLIIDILNKNQLTPGDITLELTEGVLLDATAGVVQQLEDIYNAGIGLSIDDFGTGYSSLSYLQRIPIKELKLDRSFVTEISRDKTSRTLSEATILIGRTLNLDVVAEGIEDESQLQALIEQGYNIGQGYFFSQPVTAESLGNWVRQFVAQ